MASSVLLIYAEAFNASALGELLAQDGWDCRMASTESAFEQQLSSCSPVMVLADNDHGKLREPGIPKLAIGPGSALPKPFTRPELLRQLQLALDSGKEDMPLGDGWVLCPAERQLKKEGGAPVALTEKEAALLACLLEAQGEEVQRQELLEAVWGYSEEITTHTLETHMYRLRAKLKEATGSDERIVTTPSGYKV